MYYPVVCHKALPSAGSDGGLHSRASVARAGNFSDMSDPVIASVGLVADEMTLVSPDANNGRFSRYLADAALCYKSLFRQNQLSGKGGIVFFTGVRESRT